MIARRSLLLAAVAVIGCDRTAASGGAAQAGDMALGAENAPATLIEYASVTCGGCEHFHADVWEQLKTNYIDTGRLRFIFREYPAPAPVASVAVAGFQLARCGGASTEQYFDRIGVLFEQRQAILSGGTMESVRQKLVEIGAAAGLSEQQVMACITDEAGVARIRSTVEAGNAQYGITGTPTLVLNGVKLEDPSAYTYQGLARTIDAAIAAAG